VVRLRQKKERVETSQLEVSVVSDREAQVESIVEHIMTEMFLKKEIPAQIDSLERGLFIAVQEPAAPSSDSTEIVAGIDTSIQAVMQYVESLLAQIKSQGDDFLQAFLTPIFRDPLKILHLVEYQNLGAGGLHFY
jgi:RecB family endonuclease NucS